MKKASSVVGAAGIIALLTLCSRFMGLVRKLAQSWAMSDGAVAGTYDTANTVPNVLFEVAAGGALAGAVIPIVSRFIARKLQTEESQTVSALITWILTVSIPLAFLVIVCAQPIIGFLVGDAPEAQIALGTSLLRMFALQIPLYGLSVVFSGVLQAHKLFVLPALAPLLSSIIVIGVFVWYALAVGPNIAPVEVTSGAVALLGWGTTAGVVIFSLVQLPAVIKLVNIRLTWRFRPGLGRETVRLGGAGLAALFAQQFALICVMYSTNALSDAGTFAAFNYAYAIFMVPYAVLAVPIATAVFPRISEACELGDTQKVQNLVCRSTYLVFVMGTVAAVLIATLSVPAKTVVELGNPIIGLDIALQSMALGAIGFSILYHGARVLYALGRPQLVVLSNSIAWFTVVLFLLAGYAIGIHGREMTLLWVGIALSMGMTTGVVAIVVALRRASGARRVLGDRRSLTLALGVVGVAGTVAWFVVPAVQKTCGNGIGGAFIAACVGAVIVLGPVLALLGKDIKKKVLS
ncbi:murein biosynthesis integral membrane protein MurJ [Arcanobacterium buesumense]|uniref:Virulence factor MviN n=1 Tax=Arcanobacterium buesumense TaxID=2722751 RepID=A0A6H2EKT9_9ACTO|nr:lipid II flippase MurJ [Arcanobacterium buesumense]QJC21844.1 virulence factor MviN [Arcanobacterium buesumense]